MPKKRSNVKYEQRRRDVIDLRVRGMSYTAISNALDVPRSTVWADVNAICSELKKQQYDGADQLRTQAAYRLEQMMDAYYPKAISGDIKAAELVIKVTREIATLFALNMPEQTNVNIDDVLRVQFVGETPDLYTSPVVEDNEPELTQEPEPDAADG